MRVVPVFGEGALNVSPRVGHIHITVDNSPWHFIDASGETVNVVGLEPGQHQLLFELGRIVVADDHAWGRPFEDVAKFMRQAWLVCRDL